jgi:hypothetical protein
MLKTGAKASVAICALLFGSCDTKAATITFDYKGVITGFFNFGSVGTIPNFSSGFTPGVTQVSGRFRYETNQTGLQYPYLSGQAADYLLRSFRIVLPNSQFGITNPAADAAQITVLNDYLPGQSTDLFLIAGTSGRTGLQRTFGINLSDSTAAAFNSTDLPLSLSLSNFSSKGFSYGNILFDAESHFVGERLVFGEITSLEVVATPLPTSIVLFGTGLGVMGLLGWRKTRRASGVAAA